MRKIGTPVTIRVDEATLEIAKARAIALGKPLRSLLREIIEDVLKEAVK
jgi:predicted DNA binding CopG/RHH family protein